MSLYTLIGRITDGLPLAATEDNSNWSIELKEFRQKSKKILRNLKPTSPTKCTIDADLYLYHYIIDDTVCYITLAEKKYPKQLAFQFLSEISKEFSNEFDRDRINRFSRPFEPISFDSKLNKIRREYMDPRNPRNLKKLNNDLSEINYIMKQNIEEVLERGEKLEHVQKLSSNLFSESKKFESLSKWINIQAFYKLWGPIIMVLFIILFILYLRFR